MISFRLFPFHGILFLSTTNNLATQQHHHVEVYIYTLVILVTVIVY